MHYIAYCLSYVLWAVWSLAGGKLLPQGLIPPFVLETVFKVLIWIGLPMLLLNCKAGKWRIHPKEMLRGSFPWRATFIGLCLTAAFLHTAHILMVGIDVWGIFDPMWIALSLSAAVIEEIAFRGLLFNRQASRGSSLPAAMVNGLLFALYHFPEFLLGHNLSALLGFRFWMITVMGCVFSLAFAEWKHLGMTILIHFVWNLLCHWFALA